jgi:putative oxidoreductase
MVLVLRLVTGRLVDFNVTAGHGLEMPMTSPAASITPPAPLLAAARRILHRLDSTPYSLLAIPVRFGAGVVFWKSAMTKLPNWESTVGLFAEEYKVPLLPPEIAAYMATAVELTMPVLLVLGLMTRPAALVLLAMTAVIQIFVYPDAWPTHLQWAALLLVLLARGPGKISFDWVIRRRLLGDADSRPEGSRHELQ